MVLALPDETSHDRFKRLINHRIRPIIRYVRMIGKMSGGRYEYTSEDLDKIEAILQKEITDAIGRLRRPDHTPNEIEDIL